MRTHLSVHRFILGLIIGPLILPPQTAMAQWTVFDPTQYAIHFNKRLEELNRWAETVRRYQEMYANAVEQLTTLRGVLQTADKTLFKNQQIALLANDVGKIIGDTQRLKRRMEGMVRFQISSLRSIDDRLSQGIFDPDADLRDFQNYLLYTMGRDARQTVDRMTGTARADAQLAAWVDQKTTLEYEKATLSAKLEEFYKALQKEDAGDPAGNVQHLNEMVSQTEQQIDGLSEHLRDLEEKVHQRIREHGLRLQDMENFGHKFLTTAEMWKELQVTKDDLQQTLDNLILGGPTPVTE